jgi:DNA-binding LacI/PurR family transcriptional regulator
VPQEKPIKPRPAPVRPTIKTLSAATGYSIATISKALHDSPVVTPETKALIRKAAIDMGYQASVRGMSLRTGLTYQVAVLMPVSAVTGFEWDGVEYTQILSGISQGLADSPYRIAVHIVRDMEDGLDTARRIVDQGLADGLIFSGIMEKDPRIEFLVARDFPFVALGRCRSPLEYAHVDVDNDFAAHAATARLIDGGHRRIALINPEPRLSYALDRIDGFRRAIQEAGLPACDDLIAEGDLTAHFGKSSAIALRSCADPPTGFVCVNESTALGVLSGLRELGLVVGVDVDVIAYDDINASAYFSPPLTTFYQPIERLGRQLGEFLLRRLNGTSPNELRDVHRPELVIRQPDRLGGV